MLKQIVMVYHVHHMMLRKSSPVLCAPSKNEVNDRINYYVLKVRTYRKKKPPCVVFLQLILIIKIIIFFFLHLSVYCIIDSQKKKDS